jgi:hypothetical protein
MGVLLVAAFVGCSDDATQPSEIGTVRTTGVVRGEIDPGDTAFEYAIPASNADPMVGPFVLRGSNIVYVDTLNALSVDLSIENDGEVAHPLPIGLTFVSLSPGDVTVQNPDNDKNGPGAEILFDFENGDDEWTPGEKSLPRTTLFNVDQGMSIGFVAQVDIPQDTTTGTIGGIVWNDLNEDGIMDNDEPGIEGAVVYLYDGSEPDSLATNGGPMAQTESGMDGSYRFDGLDAGYYTVIKDFMDESCFPTTSTVIHVVLVESNGSVSDFLTANFGCVVQDIPSQPELELGDYVKVNGDWTDEGTPRLMARSIEVIKCESPPPPDTILVRAAWSGDDGWDGDGWDDDGDKCDDDHEWNDCHKTACWGLKNAMIGPVTDINRDDCMVEIMGSWVRIVMCETAPDTTPDPELTAAGGDRDHPWPGIDDIEVGDRVVVRVFRKEGDDTLYGYWLKVWGGTPDKVYGMVDSMSAPSGPLEAIEVLGVNVVIGQDTDIKFCD